MGRWSEMLDPNLTRVTEVGVRLDAIGVSMPELASEVEQRLREAGIAVVSPPIPGLSGTTHTLSVSVAATPSVTDANQSSLRTQFRLVAWLRPVGDRTGRSVEAPVWMTEARSYVIRNKDIETSVRGDIEFFLGEFVVAYRAAHHS